MKVDDCGVDTVITFSCTKRTLVQCCGSTIGLYVGNSHQDAIGAAPKHIPVGQDDAITVSELTFEERLELADFMLCKWLKFKNNVQKQQKV